MCRKLSKIEIFVGVIMVVTLISGMVYFHHLDQETAAAAFVQ